MAKSNRYRILIAIPILLVTLVFLALPQNRSADPTPQAASSPTSPDPTMPSPGTTSPASTSAPAAGRATLASSPSPSPTPTLAPTATPRPTAAAHHLEIFEQLWQTVQQEYLYPDFNGLDWDAVYAEYRQRVAAGLYDEDFYAAMDEMIYRLGDEHSAFLSPAEAAEEDAQFQSSYEYVGIGVLTSLEPERQRVVVVLVFPGSPAEAAGLAAHDSILAVNGEPILDKQGQRRDLLRGPEGTAITLTVQSPGGEPRSVEVQRQSVSGSIPVPFQVFPTPEGKRIGYLLVATFSDSTIDLQVRDALQALLADGPLDGIILDNRQNTGGTYLVFHNTLAYFSEGRFGHFINRQGKEPLIVAGEEIQGSHDIPLVVLVGRNTASFGEIFAGVLQDSGRAFLIGEETEGNIEILALYEYFDGSRAWIAHDTFRPQNHPEQDWEQTGIRPDLVVQGSWGDAVLETDPVIQAALNHLGSR